METIPPVSLGEAPFVTLTPSQPCNVGDPFVFASPGASPISYNYGPDQSDSDSESSLSHEYLAGVWNRPRRIRYTSEDTDLLRLNLPVRWRPCKLKCFKYADDCVSIENIFFKDAVRVNATGVQTALAKATKTQQHFRTVEFNAVNKGMQINSSKTKMLCATSAR